VPLTVHKLKIRTIHKQVHVENFESNLASFMEMLGHGREGRHVVLSDSFKRFMNIARKLCASDHCQRQVQGEGVPDPLLFEVPICSLHLNACRNLTKLSKTWTFVFSSPPAGISGEHRMAAHTRLYEPQNQRSCVKLDLPKGVWSSSGVFRS